jgi:hypothetical protein
MKAGIITIYSGLALFVIGLISLIVYMLNARAARLENWGRRAAAAGVILVSNVPAAAAFVGAAIYIMSTYTVIVENGSNNTVDRVTLIDPARSRHEFGSIAARERREASFHFAGEGSVAYEISINGVVQSGILFGYISGGIAGRGRLKIGEGGVASDEEIF